MTKILSITLFFTSIVLCSLRAQTKDLGLPKSALIKSNLALPSVERMPKFDLEAVLKADSINERNKVGAWRFGYEHNVDLGLDNAGEWTTLVNGDRIWRLYLSSKDALSINLIFDEFYMPAGASVHLYDPQFRDIVGAYTDWNNNPSEILGTALLRGDKVVVEYYEPKAVEGEGKLNIGIVVHAYRDILNQNVLKTLNSSGDCNMDVKCPLGIGWEDPINSVALVIAVGSVCTGALVNNTTNNGIPYFLTAHHCLGNPANWVCRFNWDSPTPICAAVGNSVDPGPPYNDINGGALRASNAGSDFALIELNNLPPSSWDVYYAGWDRTGAISTQTTGVHHPRGDIKKICRDDNSAIAVRYGGVDCWRVADWDQGVTEAGSSGSPLFDRNQRIIGQLYAGGAACTGTTDNGQADFYGRFETSWNGNSAAERLKDWLDPSGTNATILNGYNPNVPAVVNDAGLIKVTGFRSTVCNESVFTPEVTLRNYGVAVLTAVDIYYTLDGSPYTVYNWTGNLASGTLTTVALPPLTTTGGTHNFFAYTQNPNGVLDSNSINDNVSTTFDVVLGTIPLDVTIDGDFHASELTWEVADANGNVVFSGGPYSNGRPTTYVTNICATNGCYTFTIYDSEGDGIQSFGMVGNYTLTDSAANVLVEMTATDGNFGSSASHNFCIETTSVEATATTFSQFAIYPNPTSDLLNLDLSLNSVHWVQVKLYNATGQLLQDQQLEGNDEYATTLDLSNYSAGMYYVNVIAGDQMQGKTIIKK